jgi:Chaperone of endosialidase
MAYAQQGTMVQSNYIVNLIQLQNTVTNASGLDPITQLQTQVDEITSMVNYSQKRIFTNVISKFDTSPITFTDSINMCNCYIYENGVLLTGGSSSSSISSGSVSISSGGTAIILNSTTTQYDPAISFQVGGSTIFTFDGQGNALYNPAIPGTTFWISSATLIADKFQTSANHTAGPGRFLECMDYKGTANWNYVSTLQDTLNASVSISSSGVYFRTGTTAGRDAGRIDSNRNWFLGNPSLTGNSDLVGSNDFTVIGGRLRYQGGGTPLPGQVLTVIDSKGTVVLSTINGSGSGTSSFVVGDEIASGGMSVKTYSTGYASVKYGFDEIARFTSSGRLGLQTTSPHATLDVSGNTILGGPVTINPGSGGVDYVFTTYGIGGAGFWQTPNKLFTGSGLTRNEWLVNSTINAFQGFLGGSESIRFSTGGAFLGVTGSYSLDVSGTVAASAFSSRSPLRFLIGPSGSEVGRFIDNGNFGIGTSTPNYKLEVAGTQSNRGDTFVSTNLTVYQSTTSAFFIGNGRWIYGIETSNVGSGPFRLDLYQSTTTSLISSCQIGVSSAYAYTNIVCASGFSTLSTSIGSGGGSGGSISSYSTVVGLTFISQFSTLSSISYINASTLASYEISTFLSTGGIFTGNLYFSNAGIGIGYKEGMDLSGALDISGLIYTTGIRGIQEPFIIAVGTSTTTQLIGSGYTSSIGWRYSVQGDIDISGYLYRNGQLYDTQGANYWARNGSNIWFSDGNVGIGTTTPCYPLDVAGRIRCYGVDVIPGPGPNVSSCMGQYTQPWQYQSSNIYYNLGGVGMGLGISSVLNGVMLDVSGPVRFRNGTTYMPRLGVNIPYGMSLSATTDVSGSFHARDIAVDGTGVFGGNVTAAGVIVSSDRRQKNNILDIEGAYDIIQKLRGVRFQWNDSGRADIGFIAQEVLSVLPEAVIGSDENGYKMSYNTIIPLLVETVKSLTRSVNTLTSSVKTLTNRVSELETRVSAHE